MRGAVLLLVRLVAGKGRAVRIGVSVGLLVTAAIICATGADAADPVGDRIGIDIHQLTDDSRLDLIRDSGMGWVRVDFDWWSFNPAPGVFDFSTLDEVVAKATARGLKIYPSIGYTPQWATGGDVRTGVPDNVTDWTTAVTAAVTRYQSEIQHWGIWNEPNTTSFWMGTRQEFIDIVVKPGADAIHAANPNAKVLGPELAHFYSSGRQYYDWMADILRAAGSRIDIVSHHTYPRPLAGSYSTVTNQLNQNTLFGDNPPWWGFLGVHPSLREVLEQLNWAGDVWLTEVGWRTNDLSEQQVADRYTGLLNDWLTHEPGRDWIDKLFLYHAGDDEYGVFNTDGSPRPAYHAITDFIESHRPEPSGVIDTFETGGFTLAVSSGQGALSPIVEQTPLPSDYFANGRRLIELRLDAGAGIAATLMPDLPDQTDDAVTITIEPDSAGTATLSYVGDSVADFAVDDRRAFEVTLGAAPAGGTLFAYAEDVQTWDYARIPISGPGTYLLTFEGMDELSNDLDFSNVSILGFGIVAQATNTPLTYTISDIRLVAPGEAQSTFVPEPATLLSLGLGSMLCTGLRKTRRMTPAIAVKRR